jgi:RecA-family ATPase
MEGLVILGPYVCGAEPDEAPPPPLQTLTPTKWKGTKPVQQRWLAGARIPLGDLSILSGDGGSGKTEIATLLLVSVAAGLGDWLGCVVDTGPALFISCEEDERNVRDRIERIAKHRGIDPHGIEDLHLVFPDLDATYLGSAERDGRVQKTRLLVQIEMWIERFRPSLVVVDSVAAVFDGDAIARRQVRAFLAMLRQIARKHETAILLLDHPSVRGMADGTGTANSVDWRNSVRSMLHLSTEKDDPDARSLEVTKNNRSRVGEKIKLRWTGLTFTTDATAGPSPYKAKAERDDDQLFLDLLKVAAGQHRYYGSSPGPNYAPAQLADLPQANGTPKKMLMASMQRLFAAEQIKLVPNPTKKDSKASMVIVAA